MNVLLISLTRTVNVVGLKSLHAYLLAHGHHSTLLYLPLYRPDDPRVTQAVDRFVAQCAPGLIGISLMAIEYRDAQALTIHLRQVFPGIPIVWGGIHCTSAPETCIDYADYVCVGEGERTLLEMANRIQDGKPIEDVPNLCYRASGEFRRNPLFPLIDDLDSLPQLRWVSPGSHVLSGLRIVPLDLRELRKHIRHTDFYFTIASRGCPNQCTYCCNNNLRTLYGDWRVRRRGVEHLIAELEQAIADNPRTDFINFYDDCFLACDMNTLEEFCREYKSRVGKPIIARSAPVFVTEERLRLLKDAGLAWLNVGLQSGSPRVCREVYRRTGTPEQFLRAARLIHSFGIAPFYDFIVDNPFETEQETLETVRVIADTPKPFYPSCMSLTFYHGTALRERALRECPDVVEDPTVKNFFVHHRRRINDLMEFAATFPGSWTRLLLRAYERNRDGASTRVLFALSKVASRVLLTPLAYFRTIKLSRNDSLVATFRILPRFLRVGLEQYSAMLFGRHDWRFTFEKWKRRVF